MTTQTTVEPCKPSLLKKGLPPYNEEEDPQEIHLTLDGLEDWDTTSTSLEEVAEVVVEEAMEEAVEVVVEVEVAMEEEITMIEDPGPS